MEMNVLDATGVVAVLVVDDQAAFRTAAKFLVGLTPGWEVAGEAESGEQGVSLASSLHPAIVLMDVNLPGISGIEATAQITSADPGVKVVLMSTYAVEDLPAEAATCGAAGYIRKDDMTPDRLQALIASV
jgi:two-component system invasion response regulator UvrY